MTIFCFEVFCVLSIRSQAQKPNHRLSWLSSIAYFTLSYLLWSEYEYSLLVARTPGLLLIRQFGIVFLMWRMCTQWYVLLILPSWVALLPLGDLPAIWSAFWKSIIDKGLTTLYTNFYFVNSFVNNNCKKNSVAEQLSGLPNIKAFPPNPNVWFPPHQNYFERFARSLLIIAMYPQKQPIFRAFDDKLIIKDL